MKKNSGLLYIVATPIGNLQDITIRAIEILKSVEYIAAEDTRHSLPLLQHYAINTPLISCHDYNERERSSLLLKYLAEGKSVALISDAGTPLISDPGFFLVKEAVNAGFTVQPIPGSCAAIAALSASGLPTDRFVFEGFLPVKTKARLEQLTELVPETRTMIFYEAPHRILELLEILRKVFGDDRKGVIARELTKKFETFLHGSLAELHAAVSEDMNQQRGEIVVMLQGASSVSAVIPEEKLLKILLEKMPVKQAVDITAAVTGGRKNKIYELALQLKKH